MRPYPAVKQCVAVSSVVTIPNPLDQGLERTFCGTKWCCCRDNDDGNGDGNDDDSTACWCWCCPDESSSSTYFPILWIVIGVVDCVVVDVDVDVVAAALVGFADIASAGCHRNRGLFAAHALGKKFQGIQKVFRCRRHQHHTVRVRGGCECTCTTRAYCRCYYNTGGHGEIRGSRRRWQVVVVVVGSGSIVIVIVVVRWFGSSNGTEPIGKGIGGSRKEAEWNSSGSNGTNGNRSDVLFLLLLVVNLAVVVDIFDVVVFLVVFVFVLGCRSCWWFDFDFGSGFCFRSIVGIHASCCCCRCHVGSP
mmetsp:Transcript_3606/g.7956  ORF Transcript_3606/g.7956 Transcript_3606/m.7956 type:complete len:305 (-) Transcript_3606:1109-2023(-)